MKINLFGSGGFKHVWRRPDEEYKDKCVMPTVKHGSRNVMVYGCMSAAGVGELYFICYILTFDPAQNAIQGDAPEGSDTF